MVVVVGWCGNYIKALYGKPEWIVVYTNIVNILVFLFLEETDKHISDGSKENLYRAFKNVVGKNDCGQHCCGEGSIECDEAENDSIKTLSDKC